MSKWERRQQQNLAKKGLSPEKIAESVAKTASELNQKNRPDPLQKRQDVANLIKKTNPQQYQQFLKQDINRTRDSGYYNQRPLKKLVKAEEKIAAGPSFFKKLFTKKPSSLKLPKPAKTPSPSAPSAPASPGGGILKKSWNQIGDPGFILFILGLFAIGIKSLIAFLGLDALLVPLTIFTAALLMTYSAIFIFGGRGLILVILFGVFYIIVGLSNFIVFLKYYALPCLIIGLLIHGLFNKFSKRGTFLDGISAESIGLVPILFFFLDVGLLEFLIKLGLPLTIFLQSLILFIPWWLLLGAFTAKKDSFLVKTIRILGMIYIFSILVFGIAPQAYQQLKSPFGPEELAKAKLEVQSQLPQKENPLWSNLVCTFSDPADINLCVQKRQDDSELKYICKTTRKLTIGTDDYTRCINEEREKKKKKMMVSGTIDPTVKQPTKVEFKISEYFPQLSYQPRQPYPILLNVENPREQQIRTQIRCFFKQNNKNITGYADPSEIFLSRTKEAKNIICTPSEDLNGTHILVFQADLNNLTTSSRLTRLFIGDTNQKTREEINELKSTYVSGSNSLSRAPKEFAWINFGLGEPETNPLIQNDARPIFVSTIENGGGGKILSISGYYFDLEKSSISPEQSSDCFSGTGEKIRLPPITNSFSFFSQSLPLTSCFVNIPYNLINPDQEFILKEFEASLYYSYRVEKETRIEVKRVESLLS